jgi:hypothetical protein
LKQAPDFYKDCRDRSKLPNDVEVLKDIVVYQWQVIDDLQNEFQGYRQKTDLLIQQLMKKIESLEQEVAALKRNRFGQRSEKSKKEKGSASFSKNKEDPLRDSVFPEGIKSESSWKKTSAPSFRKSSNST